VTEAPYSTKRAVRVTINLDPRVIVLYNIIQELAVANPKLKCNLDEFINASVIAFWRSKGIDIGLILSSTEGGENE